MRIAELEQDKSAPPPFVKPNRPIPTEPKAARRKRAPEHNTSCKRSQPARIERHVLARCPDCDYRLSGESLDDSREVIELPPPQPVEVIEHQVIKRWCPCCGAWRSPQLDLAGQVIGQGRIGVRVALTHAVRQRLQPRADQRKAQVQTATVTHGAETSWRENGQNGYAWAFVTAGRAAVRYFEFAHSRGHLMAQHILGVDWRGWLVADFYAAYNLIPGRHQRCWVHLLRALHDLKQAQPSNPAVVQQATAVRTLYEDAQAWLAALPAPMLEERRTEYADLFTRACRLGVQYARSQEHPCCALAQRLLNHQDELFQFVLVPGLPADNNLAERSLRPLVIMGKISGGTRSDEGTKTRLTLASLLHTWAARNLNPFLECYAALQQPRATVPPQTSLPER